LTAKRNDIVDPIELQQWWGELSEDWKQIFLRAVSVVDVPSDEQLNKIVALKDIRCSNTTIDSLEPLSMLRRLKRVYCFGTQIKSLDPLGTLTSLKEISCRNTLISSLAPISELPKLIYLACENTHISQEEIERFKKDHPQCQVLF